MAAVTLFEAAHILGMTPERARRLLRANDMAGPRSNRVRARVSQLEDLARHHYPWKAHVDDHDSYWVTVSQAAEILALSIPRVKALLSTDRLPHVVNRTGTRLMRRRQLELIANARVARELWDGR